MSLLAFDVGNGSVKYGRFDDGRRLDGGRLSLDADFSRFAGEPNAAAVSVNAPALERLEDAIPALRVVGRDAPPPIPVAYADCGDDRVMGVVGALHRREKAPAVLLLDAGTCLTATLGVRGRGVVGGAIAPGPDLMAASLANNTDALPHVRPGRPAEPMGRSTEEAIRVGVEAAVHGAVAEMIRRARLVAPVGLEVVAAGTGAGALAAACHEINGVHPFATLWGVYVTMG